MSRKRKVCVRCGGAVSTYTMSYFNFDELCMMCASDEKGAPNYKRAHCAECKAVRGGNTNFPGIGLAPEDKAYLARRLQERKKK